MESLLFQSQNLVFSKLMTVTAIHMALACFVVEFGWHIKRLPLPLPYILQHARLGRLLLAVFMGGAVGATFAMLAQNISPLTAIFFHAACLTIWYIEAAYLLAHGFFKSVFDDELPFEITLFISFVLMVNAGYFTLMISLSLLRAPTL